MNKKKIRRATSINDLLTRDDVNGILGVLDKVKPDIKDLIVIYMDNKDNKYHWQVTNGTLVSTATWMLESVKLDVLSADTED